MTKEGEVTRKGEVMREGEVMRVGELALLACGRICLGSAFCSERVGDPAFSLMAARFWSCY